MNTGPMWDNKEVRMSKTRLISRFAMGLAIPAAACWIVTGTFPLAAAPQMVNDAAGVTVDIGGALFHRAPVSYPESARKKGVQGTVMVEATLDGSGNVSDARVLSGPDELRKAALQSVLQWHFKGARSTQTINIVFQLPAAQDHPSPAVAGLVAETLRNTNGGNQTPPQASLAEVQAQYKEFVKLVPQDSQQKQISPELRAKLAELRAQATNVEQYVGQLRSGSWSGRTLKSIVVLGLSDPIRSDLLARLPVHEGDTFAEDSYAKIAAAVREFDEHLVVSARFAGSEATLTITAPGFSPDAAVEINTPGPKLIRQVHPVYPSDAKAARISGAVKLSAIIAADGTIKKLEVISGHPLLVPAALEAVRQWVYQPTLLNGNPVDVSTQISVSFTLSE